MKLKNRTAILNLTKEKLGRKSGALVSTRIRRKCVNLALTTRTMGDVAVVHCGGSLVFQKEAAALCDLVTDLVRRYRSVVVDLNEVSAIDGGGIGTLAECFATPRKPVPDWFCAAYPERSANCWTSPKFHRWLILPPANTMRSGARGQRPRFLPLQGVSPQTWLQATSLAWPSFCTTGKGRPLPLQVRSGLNLSPN